VFALEKCEEHSGTKATASEGMINNGRNEDEDADKLNRYPALKRNISPVIRTAVNAESKTVFFPGGRRHAS